MTLAASRTARTPTAFHPGLATTRPGAAPAEPTAVPWHEMVSHRSYLVRYAQRKLHDPVLAEDVVHDVFEAVLGGRASFGGRSALRSWLTAILKHKIVDLVRQRAHYDSLDEGDDGEEGSGGRDIACTGARPDELAEQRQALRQTLARIEMLPAGLRDAITLRVLHDGETDEVCRQLAISEDNLFVRLHRARKLLAN